MSAGAAFWLITWAVLWWHLCRWLIRAAVIMAAAGAVDRKIKARSDADGR